MRHIKTGPLTAHNQHRMCQLTQRLVSLDTQSGRRPGRKTAKTMPPPGNRTGALAGSALARNRLISQRTVPSAGVLRDQQTLN